MKSFSTKQNKNVVLSFNLQKFNFEAAVLNYHNGIRTRVAFGNMPGKDGKTFLAATRMRKLIWSEELAAIAQR